MHRRALLFILLFAVTLLRPVNGAPIDQAARGLDAFVHVASVATSGTNVELQLTTFGFPTVTTLVPLGNVTIDALWDATSLGPNVTSAPPPVKATSDANGHATLSVPVPEGDERALRLLVGLRSGEHARTRELTIKRQGPARIEVHVADEHVVPGSTIAVWARLTSAATGEPIAQAPVEIAIREGSIDRQVISVATDTSGMGIARVQIPSTEDITWSWVLVARSVRGTSQTEASLLLSPREETPGMPSLVARFDVVNVDVAKSATYTLRLRDGSGEPIGNAPVRVWSGPTGTSPPKDDEAWAKIAPLTTDAVGEAHGKADAPAVVSSFGPRPTVQLVARTSVSGHALEHKTEIPVVLSLASAEVLPEAGILVPGLEQRLLVVVRDGHDKGVAGEFSIEADGLKQRVTTNDEGEAEVTYKPPLDLGALRNIGPCAGGVAATITIRAVRDIPALAPKRDPFQICVGIDRDQNATLQVKRRIVRVGGKVEIEPKAVKATPGLWSALLTRDGAITGRSWVPDAGGMIEIGSGLPGLWSVNVAKPSPSEAARVAQTSVVVLPRILPRVTAKIVGGRAVPSGTVDIEATLTDEAGKPIEGSIMALVVDLKGGGSLRGVEALDTRTYLCRASGVDERRCDKFLSDDPTLEPLRRALLSGGSGLDPVLDPGKTAKSELDEAFAEVVKSLEGAVMESMSSPDRLQDVRRKGPGGYSFNPELLTLTTAAMTDPPQTPGGEPLILADLMRVDPQVTFDNVARRVTRYKLFSVLAAVRTYKLDHKLDDAEPVWSDPNALLRKLVREGTITDQALLDPWGSTIAFVKSGGPPTPFINTIRGYELHSPGPDGALNTGDDVRDPFVRVLKSGTPYAKAVQEDQLVDARLDMEVGDTTVTAWQSLFDQLTGRSLGLTGTGEGGGGSGYGSGHGMLGGSHKSGSPSIRYGSAIATGDAHFSAPVRTDGNGRVRLSIPLGDLETTWGVGVVALPDAAPPATTTVEVPVELPLSAVVYAGAEWTEGDTVEARVTLRNRTKGPLTVGLRYAPSGVVALAGAAPQGTVNVPAGGVSTTTIMLKASTPGLAALAVTASASGVPDDTVRLDWNVKPAGELVTTVSARWVDGDADITIPAAPGYRLTGQAKLVLERGFVPVLRQALDGLDPDKIHSAESLSMALEAAARINVWATANAQNDLAKRADQAARIAQGRIEVMMGYKDQTMSAGATFRLAQYAVIKGVKKQDGCPPTSRGSLDESIGWVESEPPPTGQAALPCWETYVSETVSEVLKSTQPEVPLAQLILAAADRPHRSALLSNLVDRLRDAVALDALGHIKLQSTSRDERAIVYAALLRGARSGMRPGASTDRLAGWLMVDRDAGGSFGSVEATRDAIVALLQTGLDSPGTSQVVVDADGREEKVSVPGNGRIVVMLGANTSKVSASSTGGWLIARFERPRLRLFSSPDTEPTPLRIEVTWPEKIQKGVAPLHVSMSGVNGPGIVDVPLPPGVTLAEPQKGVRQVQGHVYILRPLDMSPTPVDVPLRFALAGTFIAREPKITSPNVATRGVGPARTLTVH